MLAYSISFFFVCSPHSFVTWRIFIVFLDVGNGTRSNDVWKKKRENKRLSFLLTKRALKKNQKSNQIFRRVMCLGAWLVFKRQWNKFTRGRVRHFQKYQTLKKKKRVLKYSWSFLSIAENWVPKLCETSRSNPLARHLTSKWVRQPLDSTFNQHDTHSFSDVDIFDSTWAATVASDLAYNERKEIDSWTSPFISSLYPSVLWKVVHHKWWVYPRESLFSSRTTCNLIVFGRSTEKEKKRKEKYFSISSCDDDSLECNKSSLNSFQIFWRWEFTRQRIFFLSPCYEIEMLMLFHSLEWMRSELVFKL